MSKPELPDEVMADLVRLYHDEDFFTEVEVPNHSCPIRLTIPHYLELEKDADAFWADHFEVSVEEYRRWIVFWEEFGRCTGFTKNGKRCRKGAEHPYDCPSPSDFIPGKTDRCPMHQE